MSVYLWNTLGWKLVGMLLLILGTTDEKFIYGLLCFGIAAINLVAFEVEKWGRKINEKN